MEQTHLQFSSAYEVRDAIGHETLHRMASVERYNRWIYEEIAPYLGWRLLEVGCGIGNMSGYFLDRAHLVCLDLLPSSVQWVMEKYAAASNLQAHLGDITSGRTVEQLSHQQFDTVICLNVLEHIEQHDVALRHMRELLSPSGYLLLLVPAGNLLYGTLDKALGHFRRYEQRDLGRMVQTAGFEIVKMRYFNIAGIPGWWLNSRVLRRDLLPRNQLRLFNLLAPIFIRAERLLRRVWDMPLGQSLLCIARKP